MEPQQPPIPDTGIQEPVVMEGPPSLVNSKKNLKLILALVLGVIIVLFVAIFVLISLFSFQRKQTTKIDSQDKEVFQNVLKSVSPYSFTFGYWSGNEKSVINSINLNTGEVTQQADLPYNIKEVTFTSPTNLIFINNTDERDHGTEISSYDTSSKQITLLVSAANGFKIDDYVISPNKQFIAMWEVFVEDNSDLSTGRSRVYVSSLTNPTVKNLIYDEYLPQTVTAHYPVAVTDSGTVLMDTFLPNEGAGWANGMSYASFGGTPLDIPSMKSGTYGTQPIVSPDGKNLVFGGYDGSLGDGSSVSPSGFRYANISPNSIDILDTATLERKTLVKPANNIYIQASWDAFGNILYTQLTKGGKGSGQYVYGLTNGLRGEVINSKNAQVGKYTVISNLGGSKYLVGFQDTSSSRLGNLGNTYGYIYTKIGIYDQAKNNFTELGIDNASMQYINMYPTSYFTSTQKAGVTAVGVISSSTDSLKLGTFAIKPQMLPVREQMQSTPPTPIPQKCGDLDSTEQCVTPTPRPLCGDLRREWCNQKLGVDYQKGDNRVDDDEFLDCLQLSKHSVTGCADSPLYLYGEKGTDVKISINTQIFNSNAPYSSSYRGILTGDGGLIVNGVKYASLKYDYALATKKIRQPSYGKTVRVDELKNVMMDYGKKLGLSEIEIKDTLSEIKNINTKYVFVSFFDDKTSKAILPMTFSPQPDVYRNIVFYIKPTDSVIVANDPEFGKYPARTGFTAVEVSYILDY